MTGVQSFLEYQGEASKSSSQSSTYLRSQDCGDGSELLAISGKVAHTTAACVIRSPGARALESTENDTITSLIIDLYQDRSQG